MLFIKIMFLSKYDNLYNTKILHKNKYLIKNILCVFFIYIIGLFKIDNCDIFNRIW